jgi:transposase
MEYLFNYSMRLAMNRRLYPVSRSFFKKQIQPIVDASYSRAGRRAVIEDYQVFCAVLYVMRTGIPWRDLPECYGYWHSVYLRFASGSERGLWWKILLHLQQQKRLRMRIVLCDSTSFKVHRHGGGQKGGSKAKADPEPA